MAMLDFLQYGLQFTWQLLVDAEAEDLGDLVGEHAQQANVAGALEELVNGGIPPEDEIAPVFHLLNRVMPFQVDGLPICF